MDIYALHGAASYTLDVAVVAVAYVGYRIPHNQATFDVVAFDVGGDACRNDHVDVIVHDNT